MSTIRKSTANVTLISQGSESAIHGLVGVGWVRAVGFTVICIYQIPSFPDLTAQTSNLLHTPRSGKGSEVSKLLASSERFRKHCRTLWCWAILILAYDPLVRQRYPIPSWRRDCFQGSGSKHGKAVGCLLELCAVQSNRVNRFRTSPSIRMPTFWTMYIRQWFSFWLWHTLPTMVQRLNGTPLDYKQVWSELAVVSPIRSTLTHPLRSEN